jgi:hypothetical protein
MRRLFFPILFILILPKNSFAQEWVKVRAFVMDTLHRPITYVFVANKNTQDAIVDMDGATVEWTAKITDTLIFSSQSYGMRKYAVKDSMKNAICQITVVLNPLSKNLNEVQIIAPKNASEIRTEIQKLHLETTDVYKDVNAFQSPITALYEAFNKNEQAKRKVAQLEYEENRTRILKDICRLLRSYQVIDPSEKELDAFVHYIPLDESILKGSTDYEIGLTVKEAFQKFKKIYRGD